MSDSYCRMAMVGKFSVPRWLLQEEPDNVHWLLCQGLILKAECDFYSDSIVYTMFSPSLFREVDEGEIVPSYVVEVVQDPNGDFHFLATEIK